MVTFHVLYLSLCYRDKGLFDAVDAVAELNGRLQARHLSARVQLNVAGRFYLAGEETEFEERLGQADLNDDHGPLVVYHGFADESKKSELLAQADAFVLASYYEFEAHPVSLIEAMAHGLPIVGRERVEVVLGDIAEALESLADATLAMMNEGATLDEIIHTVRVPDHLADRPGGRAPGPCG